jgi:hypothetical protein
MLTHRTNSVSTTQNVLRAITTTNGFLQYFNCSVNGKKRRSAFLQTDEDRKQLAQVLIKKKRLIDLRKVWKWKNPVNRAGALCTLLNINALVAHLKARDESSEDNEEIDTTEAELELQQLGYKRHKQSVISKRELKGISQYNVEDDFFDTARDLVDLAAEPDGLKQVLKKDSSTLLWLNRHYLEPEINSALLFDTFQLGRRLGCNVCYPQRGRACCTRRCGTRWTFRVCTWNGTLSMGFFQFVAKLGFVVGITCAALMSDFLAEHVRTFSTTHYDSVNALVSGLGNLSIGLSILALMALCLYEIPRIFHHLPRCVKRNRRSKYKRESCLDVLFCCHLCNRTFSYRVAKIARRRRQRYDMIMAEDEVHDPEAAKHEWEMDSEYDDEDIMVLFVHLKEDEISTREDKPWTDHLKEDEISTREDKPWTETIGDKATANEMEDEEEEEHVQTQTDLEKRKEVDQRSKEENDITEAQEKTDEEDDEKGSTHSSETQTGGGFPVISHATTSDMRPRNRRIYPHQTRKGKGSSSE